MKSHLHPADLRALSRLGIDAVTSVTDLIESVHHAIVRVAPPLGRAPAGRTRGITGFVYRSVRGVTRTVGVGLDGALGALLPVLQRRAGASAAPTAERAAVLAALNGVLGDRLAGTSNTLALPMQWGYLDGPLTSRPDALIASIPAPTSRLLVLLHGLCMNGDQWRRRALAAAGLPQDAADADPWVSCARALGFTPLHLNYNSGHHISINGRELADRLEQLVAQWPVPVTDLALVGHSMGGLVARSACHYAAVDPGCGQHARAWRSKLRALVFLGTPHHGAPLERGGSWVDLLLGASPYSAPFARLGQLRSAGITDLRHGNLIDDDWHGHDRFMRHDKRVAVPLPADVSCHAVAGSLGRSAGDRRERVLGDGLVPVASALGRHANATRALHFRQEHTRVMLGRSHLDLLGDRDVLTQVHDWLAAAVGQAR